MGWILPSPTSHGCTTTDPPRTPEEVARLLDGFELIEPEILARYAQPHELGGAASKSPVGWRVLARKPPARKPPGP